MVREYMRREYVRRTREEKGKQRNRDYNTSERDGSEGTLDAEDRDAADIAIMRSEADAETPFVYPPKGRKPLSACLDEIGDLSETLGRIFNRLDDAIDRMCSHHPNERWIFVRFYDHHMAKVLGKLDSYQRLLEFETEHQSAMEGMSARERDSYICMIAGEMEDHRKNKMTEEDYYGKGSAYDDNVSDLAVMARMQNRVRAQVGTPTDDLDREIDLL